VAFDQVTARLSVDDVIPAEGVQDVVDTMNANRDAFYLQHDAGSLHTDFGPFIVGRCLLEYSDEADDPGVVVSAGYIRRISRSILYPGEPGWVIDMSDRVRLSGGHACTRATTSVGSLTVVAPTVMIENSQRAVVMFSGTLKTTELVNVHVLLRGVIS
jgi:hypothetical protein